MREMAGLFICGQRLSLQASYDDRKSLPAKALQMGRGWRGQCVEFSRPASATSRDHAASNGLLKFQRFGFCLLHLVTSQVPLQLLEIVHNVAVSRIKADQQPHVS